MKKAIVTTTINAPTEALKRFSEMEGWDLIVVGDLKTPHIEYRRQGYHYISPEFQEENYLYLSSLIGWNCIQRRNLGFIYAYQNDYDIIATVDDDNIPHSWWGNTDFNKDDVMEIMSDKIVVDPLAVTEYNHLWHRGFPIQLLSTKNKFTLSLFQDKDFDIIASFWNGDPDVDAICRMEHNPNCDFETITFPFFTKQFSPFNSQNTILKREVIPHYFMFPFIGRMDDIWASYYVEALGYKVVYDEPTVTQNRNAHNLTKDFENEVLGYTKTLSLLESLASEGADSIQNFIPERSWKAFKEYQRIINVRD